MKNVQIVLVENHEIVRQGFKYLLNSIPNIDVAGEAEDGLQGARLIEKLKPEIAIVDLSMPKMNGIDVIKNTKKACPQTRYLILTAHNTDAHVHACFEAGASGYIIKTCSFDEMQTAIKSILAGKKFISPEISSVVIDGYLSGKQTKSVSKLDSLTKREKEILKLISEGYKNKEIAELLFISVKTAERHRANLMKKLELHNSSALTAYVMKNDIML